MNFNVAYQKLMKDYIAKKDIEKHELEWEIIMNYRSEINFEEFSNILLMATKNTKESKKFYSSVISTLMNTLQGEKNFNNIANGEFVLSKEHMDLFIEGLNISEQDNKSRDIKMVKINGIIMVLFFIILLIAKVPISTVFVSIIIMLLTSIVLFILTRRKINIRSDNKSFNNCIDQKFLEFTLYYLKK